jgi:hypothetical protein
MRERFVIHVCPVCEFYDADPVLRRMPGSRHGPMRCFECGKRAIKALDLSRIAPSARAMRRLAARESAPLMIATEVVRSTEGEGRGDGNRRAGRAAS